MIICIPTFLFPHSLSHRSLSSTPTIISTISFHARLLPVIQPLLFVSGPFQVRGFRFFSWRVFEQSREHFLVLLLFLFLDLFLYFLFWYFLISTPCSSCSSSSSIHEVNDNIIFLRVLLGIIIILVLNM